MLIDRSTEEKRGFWRRLQFYLVRGALILVPVGVTLYLLLKGFVILDGIFGRPINYLVRQIFGNTLLDGRFIFGPGLVVLVIVLIGAGFATRNVIGQWLLAQGPRFLRQVPLVNRIYHAIDQISRAIFSGRQEVFQKAVLIEYPRKGIYSIAIMTADTGGEIQDRLPEDSISVFLPTTPNPTSGFLLFVPKREVIPLDISVEDALKLIISGGTISMLEEDVSHLM